MNAHLHRAQSSLEYLSYLVVAVVIVIAHDQQASLLAVQRFEDAPDAFAKFALDDLGFRSMAWSGLYVLHLVISCPIVVLRTAKELNVRPATAARLLQRV